MNKNFHCMEHEHFARVQICNTELECTSTGMVLSRKRGNSKLGWSLLTITCVLGKNQGILFHFTVFQDCHLVDLQAKQHPLYRKFGHFRSIVRPFFPNTEHQWDKLDSVGHKGLFFAATVYHGVEGDGWHRLVTSMRGGNIVGAGNICGGEGVTSVGCGGGG